MSVTMTSKLPADARAIIVSPNLVAARFIQLTPRLTPVPPVAAARCWPTAPRSGLDRTGVPVEWDDVKDELTKLSAQLGPQHGGLQGPLSAFVDQAAATFDGNGDSFRNALRELSQTAGRLGDSRTDLFGTVKNLQILVDALSQSNEQIVQFSSHVASVSQVLADSSDRTGFHVGHPQSGAVRRPRIPQRQQRSPDRLGRQARRFHQDPVRPAR